MVSSSPAAAVYVAVGPDSCLDAADAAAVAADKCNAAADDLNRSFVVVVIEGTVGASVRRELVDYR